ncbi:LysR family transcriptional regulator [Sphingomonas sp. BIUV-7]|uniref:LysR family transcriptional regulator n=1 Tax=Sphingomonas natans TaxID=3063330 RepID=A0ABT8Y7A4_9SPHN|nr:LysR family transcriptional regulator [Sphingomonas sp. BIUV-7]MDO6414197.1 LysR family transcriptional regulator [Sphingomonas sp. BIUV-7]
MSEPGLPVKDRFDPRKYREGIVYDVKHLRYFLAVANERSFTRGAERLNMAQPPLSRRIQEMEEELGARLFDREARPLALTAAGQLFYEQAIQVIQRAEQMRSTMTRFIASERSRFVIGLVPSMLYVRLPDTIRVFRERAPGVELSLLEMTSAEQIAALKEGRIDVGFGRMRFEDPSIQREILREEPLVAALAPNHPLAGGEYPIGLDAISALPLIVYPKEPRPSFADLVISMFGDIGVYPAEIIEVRELQTALVMAAAGEGVCLVPQSIQRMNRVDIAFRDLATSTTVPIILRHRLGDASQELNVLFAVFTDLYREWGLPIPFGLTRSK